MKKALIIIGLLTAATVIIVAVVITRPTPQPDAATSEQQSDGQYLSRANKAGQVDLTGRASVAIEISDHSFGPTIVTVSRGTTITWTNRDNVRHNAQAVDGSFVGPLLSAGQSYSHTFDRTGSFRYFCQPHPLTMRGIIKVVG